MCSTSLLSKGTDTPTQALWRGALQRAHTGTNTVPQHTATSAPLTRVVPWGIDKQTWQTLLSIKTKHPRCCHAGAVVHARTRRGTRSKGLLGLGHAEVLILADDHAEVLIWPRLSFRLSHARALTQADDHAEALVQDERPRHAEGLTQTEVMPRLSFRLMTMPRLSVARGSRSGRATPGLLHSG